MKEKDSNEESMKLMSKAMKHVADKYKSKTWQKAAEVLDKALKEPKEKQMIPKPTVPSSKVSKVLLNYGEPKMKIQKTQKSERKVLEVPKQELFDTK